MTPVTRDDLPVRRPRSLARLADLLLIDRKPQVPSDVEIAQRNAHAHLHVRPAAVARRMSEVATSAKESREQVEGVICGSAGRAALSMLFQAIMAVLVIDLPRCRGGQDIVCFCYLDEFLAGCLIASTRPTSPLAEHPLHKSRYA